MHLVLMVLMLLLAAAILHHLFKGSKPLPRVLGGWGSGANDDPRVAFAAMMNAVAAEDGAVSDKKEKLMLELLAGNIGMEERAAKDCLKLGRRLSRMDGDLTSRQHRLKDPIQHKCNRQEKEDVIEALRKVGGTSAEQIGSVRDGIGRLSASLLHG